MKSISIPAVLLVCAAAGGTAFAQPVDGPHERGGGTAETPPSPILRPLSPPASPRRGLFESVQINTGPTGANIVGDAANEPSVAVDPNAPNRMVVGWRQFDTIQSDFRKAGYAFSNDGGRTWTTGVLQPGVFRTDPVLEYNADGKVFYNSLRIVSGIYTCDLFHSEDHGRTWTPPLFAFGGDKQWMTVDRTTGPGRGHLYQAWNTFGNSYFPRTFNRSIDGGLTWQQPIEIPQRPIFGSLDVGPDGELYVVGDGTTFPIAITRSLNAQDPAVPAPAFLPGVNVPLDGFVRLNTGSGPNPGGLLGQVWVATDKGDGPRRGHVYVLCSVDPFAAPDPLDVRVSRSTDGGQTWSPSVRVNDDATTNTWQWFGTLSVAPNGRLDAVWNDTRASPGNLRLSETYYSSSTDGGATWAPNVPLTPQWDSHLGWPMQNKIGDYYEMESDNVGASLVYAATFNGEQDLYFLRIGDYDCNRNAIPDTQDLASGFAFDCNANGIPDTCDLASGLSMDNNFDEIPDECIPCVADFNLDGTVSVQDFLAFLSAYASGYSRADLNGDGAVSILDFLAFLNAFAAGC